MDLRPDRGTESLGVMQLQQEGPSPLDPRALHTPPDESRSRSPYYLLSSGTSIICEDQENRGPPQKHSEFTHGARLIGFLLSLTTHA